MKILACTCDDDDDSRYDSRSWPPPMITTLVAPGTISTSSALTSSAINPGRLTTKVKEYLDSRISTTVSAWKGSSNTLSNRCGIRFSFLMEDRSKAEFTVAFTELVSLFNRAAGISFSSTAKFDAIVKLRPLWRDVRNSGCL